MGRLKKCIICSEETFSTNEQIIQHINRRHPDWLGTKLFKNFKELVENSKKVIVSTTNKIDSNNKVDNNKVDKSKTTVVKSNNKTSRRQTK